MTNTFEPAMRAIGSLAPSSVQSRSLEGCLVPTSSAHAMTQAPTIARSHMRARANVPDREGISRKTILGSRRSISRSGWRRARTTRCHSGQCALACLRALDTDDTDLTDRTDVHHAQSRCAVDCFSCTALTARRTPKTHRAGARTHECARLASFNPSDPCPKQLGKFPRDAGQGGI